MAKTGRKRITIDDPKVTRLLDALKVGHFVDEACKYAPIHKSTYYRWLQQGDAIDDKVQRGETLTEDEQQLRDLCDAIKKAEVSGQNAALDTIRAAIKDGTWQAAAWFMERRNKKWSNRTEVTGPDGGPVQTVTVEDVDEKIRNLIAASEAERGDAPASA
jgi:hypothetical protein